MTILAETIRLLMDRRELTGAQLAKDISLSPTSISKIVTGRSKPRQVTFFRLMKRLCVDAEEEQLMVRAFTGLPDSMPEAPGLPPHLLPEDEVERVARYLEVKSMSVAFEEDVEAVIKSSGVEYQKHFRSDGFICDFMLLLGNRRVAVDWKYNVNRDWDRTYTTVKLLREHLLCDEVIIAVPYKNYLARKARQDIEEAGGRVTEMKELGNYLTR